MAVANHVNATTDSKSNEGCEEEVVFRKLVIMKSTKVEEEGGGSYVWTVSVEVGPRWAASPA
jgi:hypothetical protein